MWFADYDFCLLKWWKTKLKMDSIFSIDGIQILLQASFYLPKSFLNIIV